MVKNTAKVNLYGKIKVHTKVIGKMDRCLEMDSKLSPTERSLKVNMKITNLMVKERYSIKMEDLIKDSFMMASIMVKGVKHIIIWSVINCYKTLVILK